MKRTVIFNIFKDAVAFLMMSADSAEMLTDLELILIPADRNQLHHQRSYSEKLGIIKNVRSQHYNH
jgi:hypothetical protein